MQLTNIKIKTHFNSCVESICSKLSATDAPTYKIKDVKFPIIEFLCNHTFPYLRGMVVVVLGYDVIKGCVEEVGPSEVYT